MSHDCRQYQRYTEGIGSSTYCWKCKEESMREKESLKQKEITFDAKLNEIINLLKQLLNK